MSAEAAEAEEADVVTRFTVESKVGEDLADDGAELEPATGEPCAEDHTFALWVPVEDEILVGRRLERTHRERERRACPVREVALHEWPQRRFVIRCRLA